MKKFVVQDIRELARWNVQVENLNAPLEVILNETAECIIALVHSSNETMNVLVSRKHMPPLDNNATQKSLLVKQKKKNKKETSYTSSSILESRVICPKEARDD